MEKTLQVINRLKAKGIIGDYAIGGAVGSFFYLEAVLTEDLDIFIHIDSGQHGIITLLSLFESLAEEGKWPVQFLPVVTELEKEALEKADKKMIANEEIRTFSAEYLMAVCIQVGRVKDKVRLTQFLEEKCFDEKKLNDILLRHNLIDKYYRMIRKLKD